MGLKVDIVSGERVPMLYVSLVTHYFIIMIHNPGAIYEFMVKCQNENTQSATEYKGSKHLLELGLVKQNGTIDPDVKKIVLSSVNCLTNVMTVTDPVMGSPLAKYNITHWG
jgi:hypothetical protein